MPLLMKEEMLGKKKKCHADHPVGNALYWKAWAYSEGGTVWEVFLPLPSPEVVLDAALKDKPR